MPRIHVKEKKKEDRGNMHSMNPPDDADILLDENYYENNSSGETTHTHIYYACTIYP